MIKLSIENKIENLDKVARFVEEFGDINALEPKTIFELNLVLDELVTNIISYGYNDDLVHMIDIIINKKSDVIELQLIDDGREFNPLKKEDVDLNTSLQDKTIGGLGIHLVKQKTDELSYERKENKNILFITKKINATGD